jgi:hypothetical protein
MAAELVALPSSVISIGADATELIVSFRISDRITGVSVSVEETPNEVLVSVGAEWNALSEASGGAFPYFVHTSSVVELSAPVGARRVRAVPDGRHAPGIC